MWKLRKNLGLIQITKGITPCFFADDGDDTGGGGGGSGQEEGQGGEAGSEEEKKSDDSGTPQTYTVKVDGKEVEMTLDELKAKASEASGAQAKFQEAADLRTKAQDGLRLIELSAKMKDQTATQKDVNEFVRLVGGDPAELDRLMAEQNGTATGKESSGDSPPQTVKKEQLDPEVQRTLDEANKAQLTQIRQNIENKTREGIDKDEVLGKIVSGLPADIREGVKQELYEMAIERVRNNIVLDNKPFGPQMVQDVAQTLRSRVKKLGIPATQAHAPTSVSGLGMGFDSPQIPLDKTIERVSSNDPDYIEKTTKRVQQDMMRRAMKSR